MENKKVEPVDALQKAIQERIKMITAFKQEVVMGYNYKIEDDKQNTVIANLVMAYGMEIKFLTDLLSLQSQPQDKEDGKKPTLYHWVNKKELPGERLWYYPIRFKDGTKGTKGYYKYTECFIDEVGWSEYHTTDFEWLRTWPVKRLQEPNATQILGANPSGSDYEVLDELREKYESQSVEPLYKEDEKEISDDYAKGYFKGYMQAKREFQSPNINNVVDEKIGSKVLKNLIDRWKEKDLNGMQVAIYVDGKNNHTVTYLRYDAVLKEINTQIKNLSSPINVEEQNLFVKGDIKLSSGLPTDFKIECDALTDSDLECLAYLVSKKIEYGAVAGVPRGGIRFQKALEKYDIPDNETLLICDDVLTTGKSMEEWAAQIGINDIKGVVIFARGKCPDWVTPIFQMFPESAPKVNIEEAAEAKRANKVSDKIGDKDWRYEEGITDNDK